MACLALARDKMQDMVHTASRRAGVIVLDLCEAGAFGYINSPERSGNSDLQPGPFPAFSTIAFSCILSSPARLGLKGCNRYGRSTHPAKMDIEAFAAAALYSSLILTPYYGPLWAIMGPVDGI